MVNYEHINKTDLLKTIEFAIGSTDGRDDYSVGMRNGLKYAKYLIDGVTPKFDKCEPDKCEDAVPRSTVLTLINDIQKAGGFNEYHQYVHLFNHVNTMPGVTPTPLTGHWIKSPEDEYECSVCSATFYGDGFDFEYCPRCGAKMDGDKE